MSGMFMAFFCLLFCSVQVTAVSDQSKACASEECIASQLLAADAQEAEGLELLQLNSGKIKEAQEAEADAETEEETEEDSSEDNQEAAGEIEEKQEETEEESSEDAEETDNDETEDDEAEEVEQSVQVWPEELRSQLTVAEKASLDEAGYRKVAAEKSNDQMAAFIVRAAAANLDLNITDMGGLAGLVPYYSGQKSTQNFERLLIELEEQAGKGSFWVRPLNKTSEGPQKNME